MTLLDPLAPLPPPPAPGSPAHRVLARVTADILAGLGPEVGRLAGKTLLLSGAGGFLGQWIVRAIAALNERQTPCHVIAIDAVSTTRDSIVAELRTHCDFIYSDLSLPLGLGERIDYAIHAAGIASPYWYVRHPMETISAAVDGSRNILCLLREPQNAGARYLFFSSSEVYATAARVPTPETYVGAIPTMGDRSCYDVSKALGETLAYVAHTALGQNTGVVRIHNSFGPLMKETDHRILPRIAVALKTDQPVGVYSGAFQPTRTYCPVANTVQGCLRALLLGQPGAVYNIGADGPELSVADLCRAVEKATGLRVPIKFTKPPPVYGDEPRRRCPDITKARRDLGYLGYEKAVSLDDGLRQFFSWALEVYGGES